ncbi:hypothetical protein WJX74_002360 [Apatococcus lobatus]|uniref:Alpha-soluble NSF attachment protein n=2 Tax=Apatococcus TaxID=904362 RepID=A0AAW1REV1_9CHLO
MSDPEARARETVKKAEKKLTGFFGKDPDAAAELLTQAANQFKLAKNWNEAGATYERAAQVNLKINSKHEAATCYVEASKVYQKCNKSSAIRCLHMSIEYYTEMGRLSMAARNVREVAETQEKEGQKEASIQYYLKAAELFGMEDQTSEANKCRLKVAQFSAELDQYETAVEIYEDIAKTSLENNLLKYSAKGYLLNAGICRLCLSKDAGLRAAVERYEDMDLSFSGSREDNLLKELVEAKETGDTEKFTNAIQEYDSMTRLDAWKTNLLLKAKKRIEVHDEEDEEDLT